MEMNIDSIKWLSTEAFFIDDSKIWISSMAFNGLYRYDMKGNYTNFVCGFPNEKHSEWRLHAKVLKIKHELFFLPNRSKYIHVYDITKGQITAYDVGIMGRINCKNALFYKGNIYFISENPKIAMCYINTETKKIKKNNINLDGYSGGICADLVLLDNKIYFACIKKNIIVEYDLESNNSRLYKIPQTDVGFGTICYDGELFWLSDSYSILSWKKNSGIIHKFNNFPSDFGMTVKEEDKVFHHIGFTNKYNVKEKPFWCSVIVKNYLWLFPFRANMIIKMDLFNGNMSEIPLIDEDEDKNSLFMKTRRTYCHYLGGMQEDKFLFFSSKSKRIYTLNSNNTINKDYFFFLTEEPENLELYLHSDMTIIQENLKIKLSEFFLILSSDNESNKNCYVMDSIGKSIYENIRIV